MMVPSTDPRPGAAASLRAARPAPVSYPVPEFLEDQRRLLPGEVPWSGPIHRPEGRLLQVDARRCRRHLHGAWRWFSRRYGRSLGAVRLERFAKVVDFLDEHRDELERADLVRGGGPLAVREEFLSYLLAFPTGADAMRIPPFAIRRFLDEWGHRR